MQPCQDAVCRSIIERGAAFLSEKRSAEWTFNYHDGYPDDLDDTCIAVSALYSTHPDYFTEKVLARIVSMLIQQETVPGGPYRTWLTEQRPQDSDVDIVVNSNVAYFLSLLDIATPQLQLYFEDTIEHDHLHSQYYDDEIVIIYFLTRAYEGKHVSRLKDRLFKRRMTDGSWGNALHTALAVTALLRMGESAEAVTDGIQYLVDNHSAGKWLPHHFFIESIEHGTVCYSFSNAHVSACCIEALMAYSNAIPHPGIMGPADDTEINQFIESVIKECRAVPLSAELSTQRDHALDHLQEKDCSREIFLLPYHFAKALKKQDTISDDNICSLAVANVLGWIGYTIYDDILDGENTVALLPLADVCIRHMMELFRWVVTDPAQQQIITAILNGIDAATLWEHLNCKMERHGDEVTVPASLPDYGNSAGLAEKSLGHALGPIILCLLQGAPEQALYVEHFFREYLIARQLNDDAHDWLSDLHNGFFNSISVPLIKEWQTRTAGGYMDLAQEEYLLQKYFWEDHIDTVSNTIIEHIINARLILKKITILKEVLFLERLLAPLEQSARQAIIERDRTKRFLTAIEQK